MTDIQPTQQGPSISELAFQAVTLEVLASRLTGAAKKLRVEAGTKIASRHEETGEWFAGDLRIPGTTTKVAKVSTATHTEGAKVSDADALAAFVMRIAPTEVKAKYVVNDAFLRRFLKGLEFGPDPKDETREVALYIDPETKEATVVPGVTQQAANEYKNFGVRDKEEKAILGYLNELGVAKTVEEAGRLLEAVAGQHTGEVVQGEVVAKDEEAAA